jgi:5-methylcytosine-specific restriction endonuclease McrA
MSTKKLRFRRELLTTHPHETINMHDYTVTGQYNSGKARDRFLQVRYPNCNIMPKWFRCENPMCPNKRPWEQMQIHHIFPVRLAPQLRYDVNNMLLLCPDCHRIIHAKVDEVID